MGGHASAYERELKSLLQAEPEALRRYERSLPPLRRRAVRSAARSPFLVVRAAGSHGFDLVALRNEFAFPIEVKASARDTIHFSAASGRASLQLASHRKAVDAVGLTVLYAYRRLRFRDGDCWRLFSVPGPPGRGTVDLLRRLLPTIDSTRDGTAVLRWEDGMPLTEFFELIAFLTDRSGTLRS